MTKSYPKSASKRELVVITLLLLVVQVGVFVFKPVSVPNTQLKPGENEIDF